MGKSIVLLATLSLVLTGCSVAYNTQAVGDGPHEVPASRVMGDIAGCDVVAVHSNGMVVAGTAIGGSLDTMKVETAMGTVAVPVRGLTSLRANGTIVGSIVGFVLGLAGGGLVGGLIGGGIGSSRGHGWEGLEGAMWGVVLGGIAGAWGGSAIGREAGAGTIYEWPQTDSSQLP